MMVHQHRLWLNAAEVDANSHRGYFIRFCNSTKHGESFARGNHIIPSWWSNESHNIQLSIAECDKKPHLAMRIAAEWDEIFHNLFNESILQRIPLQGTLIA